MFPAEFSRVYVHTFFMHMYDVAGSGVLPGAACLPIGALLRDASSSARKLVRASVVYRPETEIERDRESL